MTNGFRLIRRSITDWVRHFCQDNDMLQIVKSKTGATCLRNQRTNQIYVLPDDGKATAGLQTEL